MVVHFNLSCASFYGVLTLKDNAALCRFLLRVGGDLLCDWSAMLCVSYDGLAKASELPSTISLGTKAHDIIMTSAL